jgi:hypothetical protein
MTAAVRPEASEPSLGSPMRRAPQWLAVPAVARCGPTPRALLGHSSGWHLPPLAIDFKLFAPPRARRAPQSPARGSRAIFQARGPRNCIKVQHQQPAEWPIGCALGQIYEAVTREFLVNIKKQNRPKSEFGRFLYI